MQNSIGYRSGAGDVLCSKPSHTPIDGRQSSTRHFGWAREATDSSDLCNRLLVALRGRNALMPLHLPTRSEQEVPTARKSLALRPRSSRMQRPPQSEDEESAE